MKKKQFFASATVFLLGLGGFVPQAIANPNSTMLIATDRQQSSSFQLPRPQIDEADIVLPSLSSTRCPSFNREKAALFRPILPVDDFVQTMAVQPSVWIYLPPNEAIHAEFTLFSFDNGRAYPSRVVYQQVIEPAGLGLEAGKLINIQIPPNVLTPNKTYDWDLTLMMDPVDRSGDVYVVGKLQQQAPTQITLLQDDATLDALAAFLADDQNVLSLDPAIARSLGFLLSYQRNADSIAQVETQLKEHFLEIYQAYEADQLELTSMTTLQEQRMLELAQLSAFFGLWGDTGNFLAQVRTEYPDIWQAALPTLLYQDVSGLETDMKDLVAKRLETLRTMPEVIADF